MLCTHSKISNIINVNKLLQLLLNLHEVIEQKGEAGKVVESKFEQLSDELYTMLVNHIQVSSFCLFFLYFNLSSVVFSLIFKHISIIV